MHDWGDESIDWKGVDDAAAFIGLWLRKWVRMDVRDYKEKYGTVRVYCGFGWEGVYSIWRPGYVWYPHWWPRRLDFWLSDTIVWCLINRMIIPLQQMAYVWRYQQAIQKWPHLKKEILCCADYSELLEDL